VRKNFALFLIALLALTLVVALVGCGQKTTENTTSSEPAPAETMPADSMAMDTTATMDTTMSH
jgi:uncharacterized lipoprotein YehR (DUF1307 family)